MNEKLPLDYVARRPKTRERLFKDTLLEKEDIPFDRESLAQGIGETGLTGYHLQQGVRHVLDATLPSGIRPILNDAHETVSKILQRHDRRARDRTESHGSAAFAILDPDHLTTIIDITTDVMKRWTRTLWTQDRNSLLPDRRMYPYRQGPTEAEMTRETHATSVIIEVAATAMEIWPLLTKQNEAKPWLKRRISEIITYRGPDFLRKWLSKEILYNWLEANGRGDERVDWDAFANKTMLVRALRGDIGNPLGTLQQLKHNYDLLTDEGIAARSGWSTARVRKELTPGIRKKLADMYKDVAEGVDRVTTRLDEASYENIVQYTGLDLAEVKTLLGMNERRALALARNDPIRETIIAMAKAHMFLQNTRAVAACVEWTPQKVDELFTPITRLTLARQARPIVKKETDDTEIDELRDVKATIQTVAKRLDFLHTPEKLASTIGWTATEVEERITQETITYVALKKSDNFSATLDKLSRGLATMQDGALAERLNATEEEVIKHIPWNLRQCCLIEFAGDPVKSLRQWWQGTRPIKGWRNPAI